MRENGVPACMSLLRVAVLYVAQEVLHLQENLLLNERGCIKLTDMGLAKVCHGRLSSFGMHYAGCFGRCCTSRLCLSDLCWQDIHCLWHAGLFCARANRIYWPWSQSRTMHQESMVPPCSRGHTNAVDWWTLGIFLFELLSAGLAFTRFVSVPLPLFVALVRKKGVRKLTYLLQQPVLTDSTICSRKRQYPPGARENKHRDRLPPAPSQSGFNGDPSRGQCGHGLNGTDRYYVRKKDKKDTKARRALSALRSLRVMLLGLFGLCLRAVGTRYRSERSFEGSKAPRVLTTLRAVSALHAFLF